jgi:hypothetical protein
LRSLRLRRPLFALAALAAALGGACNALIGNDDIQFVEGSDASADVARESALQDGSPEGAPSDACTADVQTDPANCGACGRDCKGQACIAGVCQPEVLVTGLRDPRRIVANPSSLFVSEHGDAVNFGAIGTCPMNGCSNATYQRIAPSQRLADDLIMIGSVLYWTAPNALVDCAVGGCAPRVFLATFAPSSPTAGQNDLFWLAPTAILSCALSGCLAPTIVKPLSAPVTGGLVYFDGGLIWPSPVDGGAFEVHTCSPAGCAGTDAVLVTRQNKARRLYADSSGLYWLEDGALVTCALGTACLSPRTITVGFSGGVDLSVADGNVYWSATSPSAILECPVAGCPSPQILARDTNLGDLFVDTDFVYWVSGGPVPPDAGAPNGKISRTPR